MTKLSTHKRWKGDCLMCAMWSGKMRDNSKYKYKHRVRRQLGRLRRFSKRVEVE